MAAEIRLRPGATEDRGRYFTPCVSGDGVRSGGNVRLPSALMGAYY